MSYYKIPISNKSISLIRQRNQFAPLARSCYLSGALCPNLHPSLWQVMAQKKDPFKKEPFWGLWILSYLYIAMYLAHLHTTGLDWIDGACSHSSSKVHQRNSGTAAGRQKQFLLTIEPVKSSLWSASKRNMSKPSLRSRCFCEKTPGWMFPPARYKNESEAPGKLSLDRCGFNL